MGKNYINSNVFEAAQERVSFIFDNFQKIIVSFSGGKDSTVMTHIVMAEAIKRNRKVALFFVDWECQFKLTITHIQSIYDLYKDHIEPYWITLPFVTTNGCSMHEPEWKCWDEEKKNLWIREKPEISIKDVKYFPFYYDGTTFEEFTPLFAKWYSNNETCANFIGIRTQESLNRYRTNALTDKKVFKGKRWTTNIVDNVWSCFPIYDFLTEDDWIFHYKTRKPYNPLYDRMYKAGMTINQMRIDEPFGETQRRGLWLYQIIEPKTWSKMVSRVAGANSGALYTKEKGNILGNQNIDLPEGHTWQSFAKLLLHTMPPKTSEHYKNKISVYLKWYKDRGYPDGIPDEADKRLENYQKVPAWRHICKALLRNDYWCSTLGFGPQKSSNYTKYMDLMKRRRIEWGIFSENLKTKDDDNSEE